MTFISDNLSLERANTNSSAFDSGNINENTVDAYANLFYPYVQDYAGNNQIVSLTIDIFNQDELKDETEELPNKNWVTNNRLRNNVSFAREIWGFREAFHGQKKSRAISNGIAFCGQTLNFYIAPQGHGTGNVDGQWVYAKTTVTTTVIDVLRGTETVLRIFDNFQTPDTDVSRYFRWTVPVIHNPAFLDYG